jgi:indole-3-glycerol phosphate synthase
MMILDDIVADKRIELAQVKQETPLRELEGRVSQQAAPLDFAAALRDNGVNIIAEIKKASPSKGLLCPDFDPVALARAYTEGGATAISVLTEVKYFQGGLDYLLAVRETAGLENMPLLRKDFIFDPYQIYEARAYGADAVLLIAAILEDNELERLLALTHELGMQCLVEVHDHIELERVLRSNAQIIGINNRDLRTFEVDIHTTERLRNLIPPDKIVVSESGISRREDIEILSEWSVDAALIGETLVTADDVVARLKELV